MAAQAAMHNSFNHYVGIPGSFAPWAFRPPAYCSRAASNAPAFTAVHADRTAAPSQPPARWYTTLPSARRFSCPRNMAVLPIHRGPRLRPGFQCHTLPRPWPGDCGSMWWLDGCHLLSFHPSHHHAQGCLAVAGRISNLISPMFAASLATDNFAQPCYTPVAKQWRG